MLLSLEIYELANSQPPSVKARAGEGESENTPSLFQYPKWNFKFWWISLPDSTTISLDEILYSKGFILKDERSIQLLLISIITQDDPNQSIGSTVPTVYSIVLLINWWKLFVSYFHSPWNENLSFFLILWNTFYINNINQIERSNSGMTSSSSRQQPEEWAGPRIMIEKHHTKYIANHVQSDQPCWW